MCRETEEFGRTCECLFQLFSPQMHCMHQQPHIKVNCARKDMFNNQCSLECNWNIYIIRRLYSGTGAKAGPRLELVSLASRGGNAVFVTHLVCVGCSYTFYPIPQVITEETLILLCFSVSSNRRTEEEMQPWLIRSTGYLNLMDVCVRCPDHSSVLLITLDEVHLLWRSRSLQQERTLDELRSVLIWGKDLM